MQLSILFVSPLVNRPIICLPSIPLDQFSFSYNFSSLQSFKLRISTTTHDLDRTSLKTHYLILQTPDLYHHINWLHCVSTLLSTPLISPDNTIILDHNAFRQLQQKLLELQLEVKLRIRQAFAQVIFIRYVFNGRSITTLPS